MDRILESGLLLGFDQSIVKDVKPSDLSIIISKLLTLFANLNVTFVVPWVPNRIVDALAKGEQIFAFLLKIFFLLFNIMLAGLSITLSANTTTPLRLSLFPCS